jgi:hypothetical protein
MKIFFGVILVFLSLGCIIATVIEVAAGKAGLFSSSSIGGYAFHAATMVLALLLLAGRKGGNLPEPVKGEGGDQCTGG